jgi:3-dehydroquinate synthase
MNFQVNDTFFKVNLDLSDNLLIKSFNKNYEVLYSQKNMNTLVNEIYEEGDFIFIDKNVYNLDQICFNKILKDEYIYIYDALEENKDMKNILKLIDILYNKKITKNNKLIVIGGGITQDVGGFAAAIYKRGLNWILIPTTILSMTDSCIGSKVNVNHNSKNMLGLFAAPNKIYISNYFLKSLDKDDIISGIGEAIKLSLIGGEKIYNLLKKKLEINDYIGIIKLASLVKKEIIEFDEFENSERKVLNYGHSLGHAIESTTNYLIPHGIAIMIGMYIKNKLFHGNKYQDINELIIKLINKKFFDIEFNYNIFFEHLLSDKKNKGNNICFIVLEEIGLSKFVYKKKEAVFENMKTIFEELFRIVV